MRCPILPGLLIIILTSLLNARTWTSNDGRKLEAEYISSTSTDVKVRRNSDLRALTLQIDTLSESDVQWLKTKSGNSDDSASLALPKAVADIVASRGTLIFEDNFNREDADNVDDLGDAWWTNSQARAQGDKQNDLVDGVLAMTISPRANHGITTRHSFDAPHKDLIVSLRMKLPKEGSLKLAYNDRKDKSVWAGHINGVTIRPKSLKIDDERTGRFNMKYREDKTTPEAKAAFESSAKQFPLKLDVDKWYDVVTYHHGETLAIYIDGEVVGSFSSPGFGHPTKRDFVFAVHKQAYVDDLKIWSIAD